ncbi:hypothetical protein BZA05DRAFT_419375 [Tricharina praecox]|uniref:uncharacterized protein n=1 Tax=Tricharina praecox TaxID=43433 RepID=UPI00221FA771|nr:uncharacterized protein BZA05DRAFT_419375 [Tricharina praecox]KAI5849983.1 hypothetical protein BZA05DRAFT_419375 [Tricharina praecox]
MDMDMAMTVAVAVAVISQYTVDRLPSPRTCGSLAELEAELEICSSTGRYLSYNGTYHGLPRGSTTAPRANGDKYELKAPLLTSTLTAPRTTQVSRWSTLGANSQGSNNLYNDQRSSNHIPLHSSTTSDSVIIIIITIHIIIVVVVAVFVTTTCRRGKADHRTSSPSRHPVAVAVRIRMISQTLPRYSTCHTCSTQYTQIRA